MRALIWAKSLVSCAFCYALTVSPHATAATSQAWTVNGGSTCQLSIPTTNTGVRPKATGFRNESMTVSNFVICPIPTSIVTVVDAFTALHITLQSIDPYRHDVTCTAAVGWYDVGYRYSSKTVNVGPSPLIYEWRAIDFGGTSGDPIPASMISSITCLLPPQVLIQSTDGGFEYDIGS